MFTSRATAPSFSSHSISAPPTSFSWTNKASRSPMSGYWFAPARSGPVTRTGPTAREADGTPEAQAASERIISATDDLGLPTLHVIHCPHARPLAHQEQAVIIALPAAAP